MICEQVGHVAASRDFLHVLAPVAATSSLYPSAAWYMIDRFCESCRYISKLRLKYFFLSFKNLQLPQKFLNLRKFSDFLHFSVDILVNLLWLPLSLKLGSKLSLNLILKKSTFGCMNDSNALLSAVLLFYYFLDSTSTQEHAPQAVLT